MNIPNPEVTPKSVRRRFTARYKKSIVEQVEQCTEPGEVENLLRREGLYSSHLCRWRKLYKAGGISQLGSDSSSKYTQRLEAENADLRQRLEQAETIIEVQKKLCNLLGISKGLGP